MKILTFILSLTLFINYLYAQDNNVKLKDLSVPNSPAFILTDNSPSVIQTANVPKEFILGVAQSFQQSSNGFPQNYSAEFTPYWWAKPTGRNVYTMLGLKITKDANGKTTVTGEDYFSGLKFTNVSIAFLNKDLIPDTIANNQKIFSIGIKTTLVKVHSKDYYKILSEKTEEWHKEAQEEFDLNLEIQSELARHPERQQELLDKFQPLKTGEIVQEITDVINQKPIFSWDIAGAYATYGINDNKWQDGRSGIWTTVSTYLPLNLGDEKTKKNYFSLNGILRYMHDQFYLNDDGAITSNNSFDIGGKLALEFDKISIGVEALYRYNKGARDNQNRTVGIVNYKVADNFYIRGAFGKNFNVPDKLIALFGISWGFGSESVQLPK